VDVERVLACLRIKAEAECVRVFLLEGLNLKPEALEVVSGPVQLVESVI